jgi:hypothetical protein
MTECENQPAAENAGSGESVAAATEKALRDAERTLEEIGRSICSVPRSFVAHGHIDLALREVRDAIRSCYLMNLQEGQG